MTDLIPLFIDCLGLGGFICIEAQSALARIGTKEVVYNLVRRFHFENALTQLFELMEEGGEDSLSDLGDYVYIPCLFNDEVISKMKF